MTFWHIDFGGINTAVQISKYSAGFRTILYLIKDKQSLMR